ncbi:MAG: cytochrome-c oxidase, cbb3-type subunit III [Burkholderiaceae bacterium]|jgi:cytochrome c oxidase cbb3-type subunit 3|nr:cytochrome-c oxidase, cbb3-type subunit III [Burkholderiaceae bacterium]
MTDFTSIFWDYYVAIITLVSVIGCGVFLWSQSERRAKVGSGPDPDTTGHVWDGDLQEFHNPLPRWWMWLFYITVIFAVVYLILFPGLGTQYKGLLKWTSTGQHAAEVKAAEAQFGPVLAGFLSQPIDKVAADPRARQMGERIFLNSCAQCHGSDARGARGFPSLADAVWFWGNSPDAIHASIAQGRTAVMPPMAAAVGSNEDVTDLAHYVLSLSNSAHDSVRAVRGRDKFASCAACHGADGKGNPALGARDLTTKGGWLYGQTVSGIVETISKGRGGVMPAFNGILSDAQLHLVSAYVYSLKSPTATDAKK